MAPGECLEALILTLDLLGREADMTAVDGEGLSAFQIGQLSPSDRVRSLVLELKMMSKFPPIQRTDISLGELDQVHLSNELSREVFVGVATAAADLSRHHDVWHGSVFALGPSADFLGGVLLEESPGYWVRVL